MSHLLLISLGPVQDFIASARQCQDLWYGSYLLSELSAKVASVCNQPNSTLIFPADISPSKQENGVANKILVVLDGDADFVRQTASNASQKMNEHLQDIAKKAYSKVEKKYFLEDVAMKQVQDLIEFMWVAVPFQNDDATSYAHARNKAEALLAARKNSKTWTQPSWLQTHSGKGVPKSSLDGIRESVLHEDIYPQRGKENSHVSDKERRQKYFVKGTERLCGIGLLKRIGTAPNNEEIFGQRHRPIFHSTSHIAATKCVHKILQHENSFTNFMRTLTNIGLDIERFQLHIPRGFENQYSGTHPYYPNIQYQYSKCLHAKQQDSNYTQFFDGAILFEQRVFSAFEEEHGNNAFKKNKKSIERAFAKLRNETQTKEPYPYYAMLLADGDKMGKALEILAPSGIQKHKHISQALEVFTQQCRDIVDNCGGSLIYAGGDDVLALLPLHTAFDCAQELQESFLTAVKTCFSVEQQQFCPTLSVGVAICHHLQPMSETRELAKKAEKLAKIQRNSLGVVFAKRSGSAIEITERWDASHQNKTLIQRIWYWAELFQNNVIPHSTAFMMAEAIEPLVLNWDALSDQEKKSVSDSCRTLAAGVLQRRNIEGTDQEVRAHQEFLKSYFFKSENPATQIQKISIELQIAREMVHVVNEIETTYQKSSNEVQS